MRTFIQAQIAVPRIGKNQAFENQELSKSNKMRFSHSLRPFSKTKELNPRSYKLAFFLDAIMLLYKRSCPSDRPSVHRSVGPVIFDRRFRG